MIRQETGYSHDSAPDYFMLPPSVWRTILSQLLVGFHIYVQSNVRKLLFRNNQTRMRFTRLRGTLGNSGKNIVP